jgi:hypothetical protein
MGRLVVSLDGVVVQEVPLTKDKTTLGRRPYNDVVIDNLAVSGEHALLQRVGSEVVIEDLNSTNGTYINGRAIRKQGLTHLDIVEVGKYKIRFLADEDAGQAKTRGPVPPAAAATGVDPVLASGFGGPPGAAADTAFRAASIKVLNGAAAGRQVVLTKVVTTVGRPGVQVASIARRHDGYACAHVEGATRPRINGVAIEGESAPLRPGDVIELAGTRLQFIAA